MKRLLAWALAAVMCWTGAACAEEALPQMDGLEKLLNALTEHHVRAGANGRFIVTRRISRA